MPKKSVMDSKSAKWLSSVDCCCSVVLLLWVIVVVVVLTGLAVSPLNRKLAVSGSITDLVVCPTTLVVGAAGLVVAIKRTSLNQQNIAALEIKLLLRVFQRGSYLT